MEISNILKDKYSIKDNLKGQKIVAAIYLATNHVPDSDPLKNKLRSTSLFILDINLTKVKEAIFSIKNLLSVSNLAGIISEKNFLILKNEIDLFLLENNEYSNIANLFEQSSQKDIKDNNLSLRTNLSIKDNLSNLGFKTNINMGKSKRQDKILSFINQKKSVGIKDIAVLFSDVSEKTIQREVSALVDLGKITKRGNKRWSVYMPVL